MNSKYNDVYYIIFRIQADLGIEQLPVDWQMFLEWIDDSLRELGAYDVYEHEYAKLIVKDYKAKLPTGFLALEEILNTNNTQYIYNSTLIGEHDDKVMDQVAKVSKFSEQDFNIERGHFVFSFRTGEVEIRYSKLATNEKGYPLIPDEPLVTESVIWKVAYKLSLRGFKFNQPKLNDPDYCLKKFNSYKVSARGEMNMPNPYQIRQMAYSLHSLLPLHYDELNRLYNTKVPNMLDLDARH